MKRKDEQHDHDVVKLVNDEDKDVKNDNCSQVCKHDTYSSSCNSYDLAFSVMCPIFVRLEAF